MLKYALFSCLLTSAWSQVTPVIPPDPPACLSKPVTLGSVTITCTALDATSENGANSYTYGSLLIDSVLFQVKAVSSDPDVLGFRIGLTYEQSVGVTPPVLVTEWGVVGKTTKTPADPRPNQALPPAMRFTFFVAVWQPVRSVQVQELKASTAQTF